MALLPVLSLVSISDDASSIVVKDTTGAYSSTNPGGYGAPNPETADIAAVILQGGYFADLTAYHSYAPDLFYNLFTDGLAVGASNLGFSSIFADGVYDIKYDVVFTSLGSLTITPGGTHFTLSGASTIFATAAGFVLPDNDPTIVYYIDRTRTLNGSGGYVTAAFSDTTASQAYQVTYESNLKLLIPKAGDKCLAKDIAAWADTGCPDGDFKRIWERRRQKIARDVKFSQGMYYDSHNLAVKLASYCSHSKPAGCTSC